MTHRDGLPRFSARSVERRRSGPSARPSAPSDGSRGRSLWVIITAPWYKSVFHFDVSGSLAISTYAGIPWLRFIRRKLSERVHVWPFDGWDTSEGRSAIVEVYPALWSRGFAREGRTGDQHDAYCIAAWLSCPDPDGGLDGFLNPSLTTVEKTAAQMEGWILGVF